MKIIISAGEASGDKHASFLIERVHRINPRIQFLGMGGNYMRNVGANIIVDSKDIAVVGIAEVLSHAPAIYRAMKTMRKLIATQKPDLLILVDYPGMNLRLAKFAKKHNVKVLYYISPQVWAWHQSRIKTIKQCVDHMAVIFPFEEDFYRKHDVPVTFVGNQLIRETKTSHSKTEIKARYQIPEIHTVIGILPGSRQSEIKHNFSTLIATAEKLQTEFKDLTFVLPVSPTLDKTLLAPYLAHSNIKLILTENDLYNTISICDAAIAVSGTITLETALLNIPMVIIYKTKAITYAIGKRLVNLSWVGICNLIANKSIVPELLQHDANPEKIAAAITKILEDAPYRENILADLKQLRSDLENIPHSNQIENLILQM